jgi:diguanylate cyclase (GGDEF)-like protein/PAS domain S-box-containing protein
VKPRLSARPAVVVGVALLYFVAGRLGLMLALVNPSATAVWPPTGIALAAMLMLGFRVWPAIFAAAFLVNVTTTGSIATSIGIAVGNTLEGVVGAYLVNRFANGRAAFERAKDVFGFAFLAGLVATTVSATIGVASLVLGGLADRAHDGSIWMTWWLGDAAGALIVAPVFLLWSQKPRFPWQWDRQKILEAAVLLLSLVLAAVAVFALPSPFAGKNYPLEFACAPFLVWVAFRFRQRKAALAILVLSGIAIWGTLRGFGPFRRDSVNESLLLLQTFLCMIAVTTLALSAVVAERRRVEESLDLLESAVHHSVEGVLILAGTRNGAPSITFANEGFSQLTGLRADDVIGESLEVLAISDAERVAVDALRAAIARGERFSGEAHARRADGTTYALELALTPVSPSGEAPTHWMAILRDVSERRARMETLQRQALHDFLTGLPNRVLLEDRLHQAILASEREQIPVALCVLDLDKFKRINDRLGHQAGDAVLKQVGARLKEALRTADTVARLGGDEFGILLPTIANEEGTARLAEKILKALEKPFEVEGREFVISASIGIALCPQHGNDWATLMQRADEAMYAAKKSGRGYAITSIGGRAHETSGESAAKAAARERAYRDA